MFTCGGFTPVDTLGPALGVNISFACEEIIIRVLLKSYSVISI